MPLSELGPDFDLATRLRSMETQVKQLATRDVLQNASIGAGGLRILNGGSLLVDGDAVFNGSLTVPSGSLDTAGAITASGSITGGSLISGSSINGASLIIGGTASIGGDIINVDDITISGFLRTPAGASFDITTGRVAAWLRTSDGLLAFASSSRRHKANITPSGIDPAAVLAIEDVHYQYRRELAKRDDPTDPEYVGPDYHVSTEVGVIAEQLHDLGLWEFVVYERNPDGTAMLDTETGEPIPISVHYTMLAVALLPVLRSLNAQLADIRGEVDQLLGR